MGGRLPFIDVGEPVSDCLRHRPERPDALPIGSAPLLVALPMTKIGAYQPGRAEMTNLAVAIWVCVDCGFIRAHSVASQLFE